MKVTFVSFLFSLSPIFGERVGGRGFTLPLPLSYLGGYLNARGRNVRYSGVVVLEQTGKDKVKTSKRERKRSWRRVRWLIRKRKFPSQSPVSLVPPVAHLVSQWEPYASLGASKIKQHKPSSESLLATAKTSADLR